MREQIENEAGMKKQSPEHVRMYAEPSEMYCRRLAEVAFAMYAGKVVASDTGSVETNPSSCQAVFKRMLRVEDQGAGIGLLTKALLEDAKLQQYLAVLTDYVPSKWLLEQERSAKKEWDGKGDIFEAVAERGLLGVSMSGGGIRSATFNLGVLQALAQLGMLPRIDYLSSVSGGGYIHQFLGGWLLRDPNGQDGVIRKMVPQAEPGCLPRSPEPIKWLVRYASYLTPKRGWFTADTWTLVSIWVRNTVLNQIPIVTGFAAAFFFLHLLLPVSIFGRSTSGTGSDGGSGLERLAMWGIVALAAAIFSLGMLGMNLYRQLRIGNEGDGSVAKHEEANRKRAAKLLTNAGVQWGIIVPWLGCALWVTFWAQLHREDMWGHTAPLVLSCGMVLVLVMMVIALGGSWGAFLKLHTGPRGSAPSMGLRVLAIMGFVLIGCLTTATACLLGWGFVEGSRHLALWLSHVSWLEVVDRGMAVVGKILKALVPKAAEMATSLREGATNGASASQQHPGTHVPLSIDPWRIQLMILPPALLSVPYVAVELTLGLLGRDFSDTRREWLARLRAWSLLFGVMWAGVVALALLGPYAIYFLIGTGVVGTSSTLIAFVVTHLTAIFASWSGKGDGKPTDKGILGFKPVDFVALIAGPIAMASMLIVVSFAVSLEADALTILLKALDVRLGHYWLALLIGGIVNLVVMGMFAWRVDINEFSMISFYRNRLTRCYLGATLNNRQPDPFTGFDDRTKVSRRKLPDQTIPPRVRDMLPKGYAALGVNEKGEREEGLYEGPFPIFCTTLNLTTGKELATQERKGASFTFTPLYSGYSVSWTQGKHGEVSLNGFVPTEEYAYREKGIHVDTAVAVSGAAVNPNMGYNSNPVLAFRRLVRTARPYRAQAARKGLCGVVAGPGKGIDFAPLPARDLRQDVRRRAKAIEAQMFALARQFQGTPADQPGTQQRRQVNGVAGFAQWKGKARIRDRGGRKPAVARIAGEQRRIAQIFAPAATEPADPAGMTEPRYPDTIADRQPVNPRPDCIDPPDHFMPRHDRRIGVGQFAIDHVQIGAADAARQHLHPDFTMARQAIGQIGPHQWRARVIQDHRFHSAVPFMLCPNDRPWPA